MRPKKYVLISLHDVTPFYEKETALFLKELEKRRIRKFSILVIPNLDQKYNTLVRDSKEKWLITKHPHLIQKLKKGQKQGAELILHGLDHADGRYLNNPSLFEKRIQRGIGIFSEAFGAKPQGYVPPVWMTNRKCTNIIKKYFSYIETFRRIMYFKSGAKYNGFPFGMESASSNKYFRYDKLSPLVTRCLSILLYLIYTLKNKKIIRYSLHVREANNGNFKATFKLLDKLLQRGYIPITYTELERLSLSKY